ncbi:18449_t:CDS:2 [Entrophospora sp. SA101]|nr:18449_t:CDS:2 [Entrophospora sp. SA101]
MEIGMPPILALWTSKADVIVGLHDGLEEYLNNTDKNWIYSGIYAVIQFNEGTKQLLVQF